MLETFTIDTFSGRLHERFQLHLEPAGRVELALVQVTDLASRLYPPDGAVRPESRRSARVPFSLIFRGPPDPLLSQRTYTLEHPELGLFPLFLVPVGRDREGIEYEAIFT